MLLGIHVKLNDSNLYSKPFLFNKNKDSFICQMLRDVDFSFLIKKNDNFVLNIIKYDEKDSYYHLNRNNKECDDSYKLGTYNLVFDEVFESMSMGDFEKGIFKKILDLDKNLVIVFSAIMRKDDSDYIFSTPLITGNNLFLSKI
jgi:hypothetical protein